MAVVASCCRHCNPDLNLDLDPVVQTEGVHGRGCTAGVTPLGTRNTGLDLHTQADSSRHHALAGRGVRLLDSPSSWSMGLGPTRLPSCKAGGPQQAATTTFTSAYWVHNLKRQAHSDFTIDMACMRRSWRSGLQAPSQSRSCKAGAPRQAAPTTWAPQHVGLGLDPCCRPTRRARPGCSSGPSPRWVWHTSEKGESIKSEIYQTKKKCQSAWADETHQVLHCYV